jgi:hypothetical protein
LSPFSNKNIPLPCSKLHFHSPSYFFPEAH